MSSIGEKGASMKRCVLVVSRSCATLAAMAMISFAVPARAQSFRVQCPAATTLHPGACSGGTNAGQTCVTVADCPDRTGSCVGGAIDPAHPGQVKCQHIGGGDGYATMGDGTQIYLFAFSPLSGLSDIQAGKPGTQTPAVFSSGYVGPNYSTVGVGACVGGTNGGESCQAVSDCPDSTSVGTACAFAGTNLAPTPNNGAITEPAGIMDMGVLAGNAPAPLMAIDEDDEFFLTLSNPGMIMRPDLFEQHTVHFHGYPNASSFFDGVPDASIAINISGSFTYYYTAPDAGTYFWHCHITPPEHLQMGMVGQLYVRPRQNRVTSTQPLRAALIAANQKAAVDPTASGLLCTDILCTGQTPAPPANTVTGGAKYAYNDGDGSTHYDVEYPIQMMGFDPNFHYVGMTFNPEAFADMKDKYFLLSGRGYPDTVNPNPISTVSADGVARPSQPLPSLIQINKSAGQTRALLRISDLSVTEFTTLGTVGIQMEVIALNARLLRDMAGNNLYYNTNSVTLGGGESADVILDATGVPVGTYFLYSTNLDHLSNDAENFGGMMTEIQVL
jgi:FtsP/CotA-like multicopper oxidase with cupredoxin domain